MASRPSCVLLNVEHSALKAGEQGAKYQLQNLEPQAPSHTVFFCYYSLSLQVDGLLMSNL